ncbi:hypothetical protein HK104_007104 [Borealophlyctis nickersoniae]|nr:hypothetical protein HK104_007104 [Borealophlyctis nickersoniae]
MKNIILWNPSPDPENPNHAFLESTLPFLTSLVSSPNYTITLIMVVSSDQEEEQIRSLLLSSGLYTHGLDPRRVVFCETEEGKASIVRCVDPACHVESDDAVIKKVAPYVGTIVRVKRGVGSGAPVMPESASSNSSARLVGTRVDSGIGSASTPTMEGLAGETAGTSTTTSTTQPARKLTRSSTYGSLNGAAEPPSTSTSSRRGSESGGAGVIEEATLAELNRLGNVKFVGSLVESGLL